MRGKNVVSNLGNNQEVEKGATQQEEHLESKLEGAAQEEVPPKDPHDLGDDGITKILKKEALRQ